MNWIGKISGILSVVLLCVMIAILYWIIQKISALRRKNWQMTTGTITSTFIEKRTFFDPIIAYKYSVLGITYVGKASFLGMGMVYATEEEAKKTLEAYPMGKSISLRFNPKKPERAEMVLPGNVKKELATIFRLMR